MVLQGIDQETMKEYDIKFDVSGDDFIIYIGNHNLIGIYNPIITYNTDLEIYKIKSKTASIDLYKGHNMAITVIY